MLRALVLTVWLVALLAAGCQAVERANPHLAALPPLAAPASDAIVRLDPQVRYQTMIGWEAVAQAGQFDSPAFPKYKDSLFDLAVTDLGINRLRIEVSNPPGSTSFDLVRLDSLFETVVLPLRERLQARGEKLFVNVCYVGFNTTRLNAQPQVYAREVLRTYQHLEQKYGFVPDAWEVELEPDSVGAGQWTGAQLGTAIVAAGDLLKAKGYTPRLIAPSSTNMTNAVHYIDEIVKIPGAASYLYEISYHRYSGVSDESLQALAARAGQYGLHTAMLEHIGSGYQDLQKDLKLGNNAAWEQYTLAYPTKDNGAQYFVVDQSDVQNPRVVLGQQAKFLRQYFKFIRAGAVRIEAQSASAVPYFDPIAFVNPDGRWVVVIASSYPGLPFGNAFSIQGLPAGTYGIKYTTDSQYDVDLSDHNIAAGELLTTKLAGRGVMTIYGKGPAASAPLASTAAPGAEATVTVAPEILPARETAETTTAAASLTSIPTPGTTPQGSLVTAQPAGTATPALEASRCLPPLPVVLTALGLASIASRRFAS